MIRELTLENMKHLDDGRAMIGFDQAVRRAVADIVDRPATPDARKVKLEVQLIPVVDVETGELVSVKTRFTVDDKAPIRKTRSVDMEVRGGHLAFNDLSEDDVRQRTIDEMYEDQEP